MSAPLDGHKVRVERYDSLRDLHVDFTSQLGIKPPHKMGVTHVLVDTEPLKTLKFLEQPLEASPSMTARKINVYWGKVQKQVRQEEVTRTEQWGDCTIHYVTYWYITYEIMVPRDIE